jgi:carboxypeptidase PM20D1
MLLTLAPEMSFPRRLALANLWLFEPLITRMLASQPTTNATIRTTTALTMFQSGTKENVLPSTARAVVNFRLLPGDSAEAVLRHVEATIADDGVEVRILGEAKEASDAAPVGTPAFTAVAETSRRVFPGTLASPYLTVGGTDASHYTGLTANVFRYLPVRLTARDTARIHGLDERVGVAAYADMVRFYAQLLRRSGGS